MASNYTINWTDGSLKTPFTLNGGTVDTTTTSLALTGKSSNNWGERLQENLLHLLENFASAGAIPNNPTIGQIWYNNIDRSLQVNTGGNNWEDFTKHRTGYTSVLPIGGSYTDPHSPIDVNTSAAPIRTYQVGDWWFDTVTKQVKYASHASFNPNDLTSSITWIPIAPDRIDFPNNAGSPDTTGYDSPISSTYRKGHLWWDTTNSEFKVYNGFIWETISFYKRYTPGGFNGSGIVLRYGSNFATSTILPLSGDVPLGNDIFAEFSGGEPYSRFTILSGILGMYGMTNTSVHIGHFYGTGTHNSLVDDAIGPIMPTVTVAGTYGIQFQFPNSISNLFAVRFV